MKVLELFAGTASFSNVARKRGHKTFTIEIDPIFKPDLCKDIMEVTAQDIMEKFGKPDVIWASPPCTTFSVASIRHYWMNGKPKNEKTLKGIAIVKKTIQLIKELNPKFFIIENPRGMLRKQEFMNQLNRNTITYCQYGLEYQKATDLWNNLYNWKYKPMCSPKSPCHVRAPRGTTKLRAIVPPMLCEEILINCEQYITSITQENNNSSSTNTEKTNKIKEGL